MRPRIRRRCTLRPGVNRATAGSREGLRFGRAAAPTIGLEGKPARATAAGEDDSDGTSKREAQRVFLHGTVRPLGKLLAAELSAKLETKIALNFDQLYMRDLAGRAQAFQKLVAGGVAVNEALVTSGLMTDEAA